MRLCRKFAQNRAIRDDLCGAVPAAVSRRFVNKRSLLATPIHKSQAQVQLKYQFNRIN